MELEVGRCYRAKRPSMSGFYVNDRMILHISLSGEFVQYDSPSVAHGRKYPTVTREKFEKWASHDVTDELPKGGWMDYFAWQTATALQRGRGGKG